MMRLDGFTLIELMVVVALIGLLAGATALSLADDARQATRSDVIGQLTDADTSARFAAKRLGPSTLHIDLEAQRLWVVTPDSGSGNARPGHSMQLPQGFRIEEVIWIDPTPRTKPGPRKQKIQDTGVIAIPISSAGLSRTYVSKLTGPAPTSDNTGTPRQQTTWLLVSGLTGQVTLEDDADTIDNLLDTLAQTRADAD